jgi:predicted nucleic acid-binding protein
MTATDVKIVDASALVAVLFEEPAAGFVAEQLRDVALVAPQLLAYEIANTCLKKLHRHPDRRDAILTQFATWSRISVETG